MSATFILNRYFSYLCLPLSFSIVISGIYVCHCHSPKIRFALLCAFRFSLMQSLRIPAHPRRSRACPSAVVSSLGIPTPQARLHQASLPRLRDLGIQQSAVNSGSFPTQKPALMLKNHFDRSLSRLSNEYLIDLLMLHPTIRINVDPSSTDLSITEMPISSLRNLVFTRDQHIVSAEISGFGRSRE
jgi:hypothetical protein